jgi:LemA protein
MQEKNALKSYTLLAIGILIVLISGWFIFSYNKLVTKEEQVKVAWSQVESNLERKLDLLPNLVKVVQKYASHETKLLTQITALRANALQTLTSVKTQNLKSLQKTKKALDTSVGKLFAVAENYPELRSSEQFLELQSQIEGSENRINITRMQFNNAVGEYNAYRKRIPANIIAKLGNFSQKAYFKADKQVHKKFNLGL